MHEIYFGCLIGWVLLYSIKKMGGCHFNDNAYSKYDRQVAVFMSHNNVCLKYKV